ncbi:Hym1p, partial [Friedmanniomyces endolithicus]
MAFLFGRNRQRSAQDIVRSTKDLLQKLAKEETPLPKTEEDLSRTLTLMKVTLQGTPELEATPDAVYQLVNSVLAESLLPLLVDNIHRLPFEARKDTQTIISNVFRFRNPGSTSPEPDALKEVLRRQPEIIIALCNGYDRRESASPCGGILKEALKWDAVAAVILYDEPADPN